MRATFLITSKVYFITLIDFFKKMRILNKAGFIFTFTKWADIICITTGQGVHIFIYYS